MRIKIFIVVGLLLVFGAIVLAACSSQPTATQAPCPTAAPCEECPSCPAPEPCPSCPEPVAPVVETVPNQDAWVGSAHNKVDAEAFVHWNEDNPAVVPADCAKCHSTVGYQDFLGADGSEAGTVDAAAPVGGGIKCDACHNSATKDLTSVSFPSGATISGLGGEAVCMNCHQGRTAGVNLDAAILHEALLDPDQVDPELGFLNIHYFAAAATLYGSEVKGGYEYEGKAYDVKHEHVEGFDTCIGCHDQHSLQVKIDKCAWCHGELASVDDLKNVREPSSLADYDGDGDTAEGMFYEIEGLQGLLMTAMQSYANEVSGKAIAYSAAAYPYFFVDTNANGTADDDEAIFPNAYNAWSGRLLRAAYNYQVSVKDPGAFAHGNKYIVQLLFDSIEDVNAKLSSPIDMSKAQRDDPGHFAGNTMPFRDWDAEGEVPYRCVKCHTADGLPEFIKNGGTVTVDSRGNTFTTGVGTLPPNNGFHCSTCHDESSWPNRYAIAAVVFPSGKSVSFGKDADGKNVADDANLCISCHQGRESTTSVNAAVRGKEEDTVDKSISFKNIHYFGAGAALFGNEVQGAYQYAEKEYVGMSTHPVNKCTDCHDVHQLEPKMELCAQCHGEVTDPKAIRSSEVDFDGDGDVAEGIAGEIENLRAALYAEIQKVAEANGTPIVYDSASHPYFFVDANKDGVPDTNDAGVVRYNAFTPRLMKAAYNFQYSMKDPGVYVHNPLYTIQVLYDSIEDLGGDVTTFTRP